MTYQITILPEGNTYTAFEGENLLDALVRCGCTIPAACGGNGTCGKCKVRLLKGSVSGTAPDDNGMILSCHATVTSDVTLMLSQTSGSGLSLFEETQLTGEHEGLGAILDIGTTTLAACLIDLSTGKILSKVSALNPQGAYGADVLSRINACSEGKGKALQEAIVQKTDEMLALLLRNFSGEIEELVIAANTTMLHLFLGVDPSTIGVYPFTPVFVDTQRIDGSALGIRAKKIRLLPSASAYVGSDISAGVLACGMHQSPATSLFVDVGTNGEIVLAHHQKLFGASTAAGPALEGACMECGMGGVSGAIDHVELKNGSLHFTTVDNTEARGICGSGYIDLFALLLDQGLIEESGAWNEECTSPLMQSFEDGSFYLTREIYLSQQDIRQFQLAKSAIAAGIETLLQENGVSASELDALYLAGGLGYYMNIDHAARTGLLPPALTAKTKAVGNTALAGARLCLLSSAAQEQIEHIATETEIVELSFSPVFQDAYMENMMFLEG